MSQETQGSRSVRAVLMDYLAQREHSVKELYEKAVKRLGPEASESIEGAIAQLSIEGLQSDERYAESLCRYRIGKGYGPNFILQALREKGIALDVQREALSQLNPDWFDLAQSALQKKFGSPMQGKVDPIQRRKELQRRMRFLSYRGFSADIVSAVVAAEDLTET